MSFFTVDGEQVTGKIEDMSANFKTIPDGTQANACIKKAERSTWDGIDFYNITWKILDGEFKNRIIFQKIRCFDKNKNKRKRALNMLYRIYCLCKETPPELAPLDEDLKILENNVLGIRIGMFINDLGQEFNYVEMIFESSPGFEVKTGKPLSKREEMQQYTQVANQFFNENTKQTGAAVEIRLMDDNPIANKKIKYNDSFDDDIPF